MGSQTSIVLALTVSLIVGANAQVALAREARTQVGGYVLRPVALVYDIPSHGEKGTHGPGSATYCTVPAANGQTDISFLDATGNEIVHFGQICADFREEISAADSGRIGTHSLTTTWNYEVQRSSVNPIAWFYTEFYEAGTTPSVLRWRSKPNASGSWPCTTSRLRYSLVDKENLDPTSALILPGASSDAEFEIRLNYRKSC